MFHVKQSLFQNFLHCCHSDFTFICCNVITDRRF